MSNGDSHAPNSSLEMKPDKFKYNVYHSEMKHEDNLINQRMNWLLVSQTLLFAALGQFIDKNKIATASLVKFVGLASSLIFLASMFSGVMSFWSYYSNLRELKLDKESYPQLNRNKSLVITGLSAYLLLPLIFMFAWGILLCCHGSF